MTVVQMASTAEWLAPPKEIALAENEVHVWRASLEWEPSDIQAFRRLLSSDEIAKAERFYFEKDRGHFIAARGLLRTVLSRYLKVYPGRLQFFYKLHGKPALHRESGGKRYSFNLSRSHGLLLLAITRGREIGVDIEHIRSDFGEEGQEIAERFFSPNEVVKLSSLPTEQKAEAFFNCWTRKEAYIKARGDGLSIPLDQFEVSLSPGESAALMAPSQEISVWSMKELHPGPGYAAALVVRGHALQFKYWQWRRMLSPKESGSVNEGLEPSY